MGVGIEMIRGCIICDEMHFINGANKVAEKIASNYEYFYTQGIEISYIYTQDQIIPCKNYVSTLGDLLNDSEYLDKRSTVARLKQSKAYHTKLVQCYLENKNIRRSKMAIENYKASKERYDFIIFNSINCAYYYLKDEGIDKSIFTILISHIASDPTEQLLIDRPEIKNTSVERNTYAIYEYTVRNVDKLVTICNMAYEYIKSKYNIESTMITNGVEDVEYIVPKEGIDYKNKDVLKFVCVASVTNRKGQDLIVNAVANLTNEYKSKIQVNIVGQGNEFQKICNMIENKQLEDTIHMLGARNDIEAILKENDIFILSSRADTVPVAILEAMRAGLPVIATPVGEIPQMVSGGGILIDADENSIKEVIIKCVDNRDFLSSLSRASRKQYESHYSIHTMLDLYSRAISDGVLSKEK